MFRTIIHSLRTILSSLAFRLLLIFLGIIIGLIIIYTNLGSSLQKKILEDAVQSSAVQSGDLINKSLNRMMMLNDRESLYETIQTIGGEPGVERIRIYDKSGIIKFSTRTEESGTTVDMKAEACYACHSRDEPFRILPEHEKSRIFRTEDDRRVLGLILPIQNEKRCSDAGCHAHDPQKNILGVLDVQMSLENLDLAIARGKRQFWLITYALLIVSAVLIGAAVILMTHRPIRKLTLGTERLAAGNLRYRLNIRRRDELGTLAESFNHMAESLNRAYDDLKALSESLEDRVREKTVELEEIHKAMLHVERMASLGKMAATVGHELNNPLAGIVNYASLLKRKLQRTLPDVPDRDGVLENLELIRSESLRCGEIVKNLLIFARGAGIKLQTCRIRDIVTRAMNLVSHHLKLAKVESDVHIETEPAEIVCDADQMVQMFVALFVNAVEAMPHGGRLGVAIRNAESEPKQCLISVRDTGTGIPAEIREKIFEPFYSTKKAAKGVGLGLAVVYGIVQRHKGRIRVDSPDGGGTAFHIQLPFDPNTAGDNEAAGPAPGTANNLEGMTYHETT